MASRIKITHNQKPIINTDRDLVVTEPDSDYGLSDNITYEREEETALLQFTTGAQWEVSYYTQILHTNDEPKAPDIYLEASMQRYKKIERLILFMESSISQVEYTEVSGEAILNAGFTPQHGDIFIARIRNNRLGMFVVETISKRTYSTQEIFNISFKILAYEDTNKPLFEHVVSHTVEDFIYDDDTVGSDKKKIITKRTYDLKLEIESYTQTLFRHYHTLFYQREVKTFAYETDHGCLYLDMALLDHLYDLFPVSEYKEMMHCDRYDNFYRDMKRFTLYDLLNPDLHLRIEDICPYYTIKSMEEVLTHNIHVLRRSRDYRYKNFNYVLEPTVKAEESAWYFAKGEILENAPRVEETLKRTRDLNQYVAIDSLKVRDHSYGLGRGFYEQNGEMQTYFEQAVTRYILKERLDESQIQRAIDECFNWEKSNKFYLIPVLITLLYRLKGEIHGRA